jgi:hypothetical protein
MPSAGIEPATYNLGGCRSIQLSYESKTFLDFRFWTSDCPIFLRIVTNQRMHIVTVKASAPAKKY